MRGVLRKWGGTIIILCFGLLRHLKVHTTSTLCAQAKALEGPRRIRVTLPKKRFLSFPETCKRSRVDTMLTFNFMGNLEGAKFVRRVMVRNGSVAEYTCGYPGCAATFADFHAAERHRQREEHFYHSTVGMSHYTDALSTLITARSKEYTTGKLSNLEKKRIRDTHTDLERLSKVVNTLQQREKKHTSPLKYDGDTSDQFPTGQSTEEDDRMMLEHEESPSTAPVPFMYHEKQWHRPQDFAQIIGNGDAFAQHGGTFIFGLVTPQNLSTSSCGVFAVIRNTNNQEHRLQRVLNYDERMEFVLHDDGTLGIFQSLESRTEILRSTLRVKPSASYFVTARIKKLPCGSWSLSLMVDDEIVATKAITTSTFDRIGHRAQLVLCPTSVWIGRKPRWLRKLEIIQEEMEKHENGLTLEQSMELDAHLVPGKKTNQDQTGEARSVTSPNAADGRIKWITSGRVWCCMANQITEIENQRLLHIRRAQASSGKAFPECGITALQWLNHEDTLNNTLEPSAWIFDTRGTEWFTFDFGRAVPVGSVLVKFANSSHPPSSIVLQMCENDYWVDIAPEQRPKPWESSCRIVVNSVARKWRLAFIGSGMATTNSSKSTFEKVSVSGISFFETNGSDFLDPFKNVLFKDVGFKKGDIRRNRHNPTKFKLTKLGLERLLFFLVRKQRELDHDNGALCKPLLKNLEGRYSIEVDVRFSQEGVRGVGQMEISEGSGSFTWSIYGGLITVHGSLRNITRRGRYVRAEWSIPRMEHMDRPLAGHVKWVITDDGEKLVGLYGHADGRRYWKWACRREEQETGSNPLSGNVLEFKDLRGNSIVRLSGPDGKFRVIDNPKIARIVREFDAEQMRIHALAS